MKTEMCINCREKSVYEGNLCMDCYTAKNQRDRIRINTQRRIIELIGEDKWASHRFGNYEKWYRKKYGEMNIARNLKPFFKISQLELPFNLFLYGPPGVGKTAFTHCLLHKFWYEGGVYTEFFGSTRQLARQLIFKPAEWYLKDEYLKNLSNCKLLIINDLGRGVESHSMYEDLCDIIEYRCSMRRRCSTIVTSLYPLLNLSEKFCNEHGDYSLGSRLSELFEPTDLIHLNPRDEAGYVIDFRRANYMKFAKIGQEHKLTQTVKIEKGGKPNKYNTPKN